MEIDGSCSSIDLSRVIAAGGHFAICRPVTPAGHGHEIDTHSPIVLMLFAILETSILLSSSLLPCMYII